VAIQPSTPKLPSGHGMGAVQLGQYGRCVHGESSLGHWLKHQTYQPINSSLLCGNCYYPEQEEVIFYVGTSSGIAEMIAGMSMPRSPGTILVEACLCMPPHTVVSRPSPGNVAWIVARRRPVWQIDSRLSLLTKRWNT
jgi:hypothetical protein